MSIYSDYNCGALSDDEFNFLAARMNRRDRYEKDHEFDDGGDEDADTSDSDEN